MEEYRKKVENRLRVYTIICIGSLALYIALKFLIKGASDFAQGLTMGVLSGMEIVAVYNLARMFIAIRNEDKLREMYIQETDERNHAIQKATAQKSAAITMLCTSAAALAAGFFDTKVCITLAAVMTFSALVTVIVNAYYSHKM